MRNFILIALTFHLLVVTVVEINGDYTFGDIISFRRKCGKSEITYKHFAVYVGTDDVFGQGKDKDIFHRIYKPIDGKYCVFGFLKNEGEHEKDNYLDNKLTPSSQDDIIQHIKAMTNKTCCGNYNLENNNCEHLATQVRYGEAYLNQNGTMAGEFIKMLKERKPVQEACEAIKDIPNEICKKLDDIVMNADFEALCNNAVMLKSVLKTPTLFTCLAFLFSFFYMT